MRIRHGYLEINSEYQKLFGMEGKTFIALYDGQGTVIAIPDIGFAWGDDFQDVASSDNFLLWRNMLSWLTSQSRLKRK